MEFLGLGVFAVFLLGGAWLLIHLLGKTERNEGLTYSGGLGGKAGD